MEATEAELRAAVADRLRARRGTLERSIATRVYAISEPTETADPTYLEGLRESLAVALDFALVALELGERRAPDVPPALLAQARMAARNRIGLETVVRRYAAGYALIVDCVLEAAAEAPELGDAPLRPLFRGQAAIFDRLIAAVSEEHARQAACLLGSSRQRRVERVRRLLCGEAIDPGELEYDLDGFHLGVAANADAEPVVGRLASNLGLRMLCVTADGGQLWAWLGSPCSAEPPDCARVAKLAESLLPQESTLAFGFPADGLHGWRLTHRQALAALSVAGRHDSRVVLYGNIGLLASVSRDELLREFLQRIYIRPLAGETSDGETLKRTLRVYFACGRQVSSTAAALGASRQTIGKRLKTAEARLGQPLDGCAGELEIALRYADLFGVAG